MEEGIDEETVEEVFSGELSEEEKKKFFANIKNKEYYEKWINNYKNWCENEKKAETETSVLQFLQNLRQEKAPSTLWSLFAVINKYFKVC